MEPEYIRLKQVLELVCVGRSTFYRLREKLKIPYYPLDDKSNIVFYKPKEVKAIIDKYRRNGGEEEK